MKTESSCGIIPVSGYYFSDVSEESSEVSKQFFLEFLSIFSKLLI